MSNLAQKLNRLALAVKRLFTDLSNKVDVVDFNQYFTGMHTSDIALNIAHPTAIAGSYALVDAGEGEDALFYWFDVDDGWITNGQSVSLSSTDALVEGSANLYFTSARAISAVGSTLATAVAASLDARVNTQTGASYTLQSADNDGKTYLRMTNASANTVEIISTQTKPISISQRGVGTTTLQQGAGVTLNGTLAFTAQHQTKTIIPLGSGIFDIVG